MNPGLRRSTLALLASSLLLTIGRGATLPFMTIYLNRQYGLGVDLIGYALTSALTIGVVFSLGFGILADKFDKKRYMLLAIIAFACGFIAIPMVHNVVLVVLLFALINCAYSVFSTVLKAWFADNLTATTKTRIFSLNYTVLNIGWTVGPPLGTLLVMQSINGCRQRGEKCRYLVSLRSAARQSIIVVYAFGISGLLCGGCLCVLYFTVRYGRCR
ncbi:MFS transporter [Salmonella enterica subsp. enterica serovar Kiambu]